MTRTIEKERKRKAIIAKHKLVDQFEEKPVERCQVKSAEQFLEKPFLQCEEKALDQCKRKKTSILDIEENAEIDKVIRLSKKFAPKDQKEQILKIWRSYCFEI